MPQLKTEIGWHEQQYGHIVVALQAAYAIGPFGVGRPSGPAAPALP